MIEFQKCYGEVNLRPGPWALALGFLLAENAKTIILSGLRGKSEYRNVVCCELLQLAVRPFQRRVWILSIWFERAA